MAWRINDNTIIIYCETSMILIAVSHSKVIQYMRMLCGQKASFDGWHKALRLVPFIFTVTTTTAAQWAYSLKVKCFVLFVIRVYWIFLLYFFSAKFKRIFVPKTNQLGVQNYHLPGWMKTHPNICLWMNKRFLRGNTTIRL